MCSRALYATEGLSSSDLRLPGQWPGCAVRINRCGAPNAAPAILCASVLRTHLRGKWSSAYEALQDGRPNRSGLLQLYLQQLPATEPLLLAGDHTAWPRLEAQILAERSFQHPPAILSCQRPVMIGHGCSTVAVIPEQQGCWALPLLQERITDQKPIEKGAQQLRQICLHLDVRPLSLWDAEYGCAAFLMATQNIPADKLHPLTYQLSAPRSHPTLRRTRATSQAGDPLQIQGSTTWWAPDQTFPETGAGNWDPAQAEAGLVWLGGRPTPGAVVVRAPAALPFGSLVSFCQRPLVLDPALPEYASPIGTLERSDATVIVFRK